jgi:outer membrane protein
MKKALAVALAAALAGGSLMAQAYEKGDFVLRLGAVNVDPDSDSSNIDLRAYEPDLPILHAEVDDDTQFGIIPMYMVTDHVGIELLAATPFEHDITLNGKDLNLNAGSTKHLPPTITAQWYPRGGKEGWQPFLGVGVNYTVFFDEKTDKQLDETLNAILGATKVDLDLDDSFGLSAQAGVDIPFYKDWALSLAVWYIQIDTNAKVSTDVGNVNFKTDIDPFVYHIGIAHRF